MKRLILLISIFVTVGIFAACGSTGEVDELFVGTWAWDRDGVYHYNFMYDGTGERVFPEFTETFEWGVDDDTLFIRRDEPGMGEIRNERWTFVMEDYALTLTSQHDDTVTWTYFFIAEEQDPYLIGTWSWDIDHGYTLSFDAEGAGRRGHAGEQEAFTWTSHANRIHIHSRNATYGVRGEVWTFTITGDSMHIDSVQADDFAFTYTRLD
ncbi:MAG: hypothetical protein FWF78_08560 [Defluviitaleaceae bacterium]|nr:hypothetical protein [Defluviitaleaceae bacterium]